MTPGPGIYYGEPFAAYEQRPGVNKSCLFVGYQRSMAHYRYALDHPKPPTPAMILGEAVHLAVLQPDIFSASYTKPPPPPDERHMKDGKPAWNRTFKEHKAAWAIFLSEIEAHGQTLLDPDEYDAAVAISAAVNAHPTARLLLNGARFEVSMQWVCERVGIMLKGRIDAVNNGVVIDLKTCRIAAPRPFGHAAYDMGYHFQAAMYVDGAKVVAKDQEIGQYVLLAVENEPPYAVKAYEVDEAALEIGRGEYQSTLDQVRRCQETGIWPAYGEDIGALVLPSYAGMELRG